MTTTNANLNDTDRAVHQANVDANATVLKSLLSVGWTVEDTTEERDDLGVIVSTTFEVISPEGVALSITIAEPEWATEARLG